ncbi:hypothetical protein EMCRGX_G010390 [Ephydatia muelleri]
MVYILTSRDSEGCGYQVCPVSFTLGVAISGLSSKLHIEGHVILKGVAIRFVHQRGAILFQNRQTKARKLCIGITFCEAIQAGCWLERMAGYATQRGRNVGFLDLPETSWLNKSAKTCYNVTINCWEVCSRINFLCFIFPLSDLGSLVQAMRAMRVVVAAATVATGEVVVEALVPMLVPVVGLVQVAVLLLLLLAAAGAVLQLLLLLLAVGAALLLLLLVAVGTAVLLLLAMGAAVLLLLVADGRGI